MMNSSQDPYRRTVGYARNKTSELLSVKMEIAKKRDRFRKPAGTPTNDREKFISKPDSYNIEIGGRSAGILPEWVDYYEESLEKIKKVGELTKEISRLITQKIKIQFGTRAKELETDIQDKTTEATSLLRDCESNHKKICSLGDLATETRADKQAKENIKKALAIKIQESAMTLRKTQKNLYDKMKETEDLASFGNSHQLPSTDHSEDGQQEQEMMNDLAEDRDQDINMLVGTINELSHMFKQMNQLVIEQGTIIDRIDYNLETAETHVTKAKKQLKKAAEIQRSGCGDKCIKMLVILNIVFAILFLLKFRK